MLSKRIKKSGIFRHFVRYLQKIDAIVFEFTKLHETSLSWCLYLSLLSNVYLRMLFILQLTRTAGSAGQLKNK